MHIMSERLERRLLLSVDIKSDIAPSSCARDDRRKVEEMKRSAIIVELAHVGALSDLRDLHAQDARLGVPPHITVLFPFVDLEADGLTPSLRSRLARAISGVTPFEYRLTDTRWFGDTVLWLAPDDPEPFRRLTRAVLAEFPGCRPYDGAHDGLMPHATVGDSGSLAALRRAEEQILPALPLCGMVAHAALIVEADPGTWRRAERFALGRADNLNG